MPLTDGYGVVVGRVTTHFIDPPDAEGRWPHYHINVATPLGEYECVINLKSRTQIKVLARIRRCLDLDQFSAVLALPEGFHRLQPEPTSGALDVIRHPGLATPPGCNYPIVRCIACLFGCKCPQWTPESGLNLVEQIHAMLYEGQRIRVFGEPYREGLGLHNVHINQGDPIGSQFSAENGIWQDGGVLLEYEAHWPWLRYVVLNTRFETQSLQTDSSGRPI